MKCTTKNCSKKSPLVDLGAFPVKLRTLYRICHKYACPDCKSVWSEPGDSVLTKEAFKEAKREYDDKNKSAIAKLLDK